MRSMSLRALWRDPPAEESVQVTHGGQIIGTFVPVGVETPDAVAMGSAPVAAARPRPAGGLMGSQAERDKVLRKLGKA